MIKHALKIPLILHMYAYHLPLGFFVHGQTILTEIYDHGSYVAFTIVDFILGKALVAAVAKPINK